MKAHFRFAYITTSATSSPPIGYITSVRCVLLHHDEVLVMRNPSDTHLTPGGRIETGESLREALDRELLEETGWTIQPPVQIGFMHLHHLAPKPPDFTYLYPDFLQIVYAAQTKTHHPDARDKNDYELEAFFHPIKNIDQLQLQPRHLLYLDAAQQALNA